MSNRIIADVYYVPGTRPTKKVVDFIDKNDGLMNKYYFALKNVTCPKYKAEAKKRGVERAPAVVINDKLYTGVEPIIKILSGGINSTRKVMRPASDEDRLVSFMQREAMNTDDDEDDMCEGMSMDDVRKQISQLSSRKPHCKSNDAISTPPRSRKKSTPRKPVVEDDGDTAFLRMAGRDNIDPRSDSSPSYPIEDGESLLEKYYEGINADMSF